MKACPYCAEEIQEEAVKCRFCGEWLDPEARPEWAKVVTDVGMQVLQSTQHPEGPDHIPAGARTSESSIPDLRPGEVHGTGEDSAEVDVEIPTTAAPESSAPSDGPDDRPAPVKRTPTTPIDVGDHEVVPPAALIAAGPNAGSGPLPQASDEPAPPAANASGADPSRQTAPAEVTALDPTVAPQRQTRSEATPPEPVAGSRVVVSDEDQVDDDEILLADPAIAQSSLLDRAARTESDDEPAPTTESHAASFFGGDAGFEDEDELNASMSGMIETRERPLWPMGIAVGVVLGLAFLWLSPSDDAPETAEPTVAEAVAATAKPPPAKPEVAPTPAPSPSPYVAAAGDGAPEAAADGASSASAEAGADAEAEGPTPADEGPASADEGPAPAQSDEPDAAGDGEAQTADGAGADDPTSATPAAEPVPDSPELADARSAYTAGRYKDARAKLDALLAKTPGNAAALLLLAQVQLEQGEPDEALATATRCIKSDPTVADCWLTLGVRHQDRGDIEPAIAAYEKYLALAPKGHYARDVTRQLGRLRR